MRFKIGITILALLIFLPVAAYAAAAEASEYILGPEDSIAVNVLGHPEFSGDYFIPADGAIDLPIIGKTHAAGESLAGLSATIRNGLKFRLLDPEVSVSLKSPRLQRIYVLGAVDKPDIYDAKPGWRITEAVAAAGGLQADKDIKHCHATLLRARLGEQKRVNLALALSGDREENLVLESGDVLTVDSDEISVYVAGEVEKPGLYKLHSSDSGVVQALAVAQGVKENAAISRAVITHQSGGSETVNLSGLMGDRGGGTPSIRLKDGDTIMIPASTARVAVLGYVNTPGFFPLKDSQPMLLSDALGLAGGMENKRGGLNGIALIRSSADKQERITVDYGKFLKNGDVSQNPVLCDGDVIYVPQTGKPDWDLVSRFAAVLANLVY